LNADDALDLLAVGGGLGQHPAEHPAVLLADPAGGGHQRLAELDRKLPVHIRPGHELTVAVLRWKRRRASLEGFKGQQAADAGRASLDEISSVEFLFLLHESLLGRSVVVCALQDPGLD
jgi:hypothetical protein